MTWTRLRRAILPFALLGLIAPTSPGQSASDGELLQAIDALQAPLQDFYCEYEGERIEDKQSLGNDSGVSHRFAGIFRYKAKDSYINDIFDDTLPTRRNPERSLGARVILSNGTETQPGFSRTKRTSSKPFTRHATSSDFLETGSCGRIFLVRSLRELLKYDKKLLVDEGTEEVDGVSCRRFAFVMGQKPYSIETGLVERFWIDMGRGGHVLKQERWSRGQLRSTTSEIVLEGFEIQGKTVWVPISGTARILHDDEVSGEEHYRVLKETIRINQGIRDTQFSTWSAMGTPISDHLRRVVSEYRQEQRQKPPPPSKPTADPQTRLQEALRKAESSGVKVVAGSWSREGSTPWIFWGPFSVFLAGSSAAIVLYLIRSRGSS